MQPGQFTPPTFTPPEALPGMDGLLGQFMGLMKEKEDGNTAFDEKLKTQISDWLMLAFLVLQFTNPLWWIGFGLILGPRAGVRAYDIIRIWRYNRFVKKYGEEPEDVEDT